jgi:hypothetical protein
MIFISDNESAKTSQPGEGSLDYISSPVAIPESVVLPVDVSIILPMRRKKVDASLSELFSMRIAVICLVSDHSSRSRLGSAGSFFRDFDVCDDFLQEPDLSGRGRVGMASQRNTLAIDHHQVLRSLASLRFSDSRAPFFAGMNVASTKDSSQSRIPSASNSERKARHLAPVLRTQRIPCKQARSGAGGGPPSGLGGRGGINGLIFSHCSSVSIGFRALIGSPPMRLIREI